jgi:hypothetical protein
MPQASPELAAEWPGFDAQAMAHLRASGFKLRDDWTWKLPRSDYQSTPTDISAVNYLMDEWDFGGVEE